MGSVMFVGTIAFEKMWILYQRGEERGFGWQILRF